MCFYPAILIILVIPTVYKLMPDLFDVYSFYLCVRNIISYSRNVSGAVYTLSFFLHAERILASAVNC